MAKSVSARARVRLARVRRCCCCSRSGRAAAKPQSNFKLDHPLTAADAVQTAMLPLAVNLKKHSDGRVSVTVLPADQLRDQADFGEMVRQGTAVIHVTEAPRSCSFRVGCWM
jgi:TRAP-type C4-dicarboxylate transport system substrate-binding protein